MTKVRILKGIFKGQDLEFVGYTHVVGGFTQINKPDRLVVVKTPEDYKKRDLFYYLSNNVGPLQVDSWSNTPLPKYPFYIIADKDGYDVESFNNLDKALEAAQKQVLTMDAGGNADDNVLYIFGPIYKIKQSISAKVTKL